MRDKLLPVTTISRIIKYVGKGVGTPLPQHIHVGSSFTSAVEASKFPLEASDVEKRANDWDYISATLPSKGGSHPLTTPGCAVVG
jgi:hypothetical protein